MTDTFPLGHGAVRRISRRLMLGVLGAALVVAAIAAGTRPARAQHDDLVRFLLGAAAVAIIVRGIDAQAQVGYIDRRTLPAACLETVQMRGRHVDVFNARCLSRAGYHNLPHRCEVRFRTNHGHRTGYEASCLQRAGYRVQQGGYRHPQRERDSRALRLPAQCEVSVGRGNRRQTALDAQCLRQSGLRNLPQHCALTGRQGQRLYDIQCLENAGYRRARH